jgi:hypothetical protein
MNGLRDLKRVETKLEQRAAAGEFKTLCRAMMLGNGSPIAARALMGKRLTDRVDAVLSRATPGMLAAPGGSPSTWGAELSTYNQLAGAFLESLAHRSVFDAAVASMRQIPVRGSLPVVDATVAAFVVSEGEPKQLGELSTNARLLDPLRVVAIIFATKELLTLGGATAASLFISN